MFLFYLLFVDLRGGGGEGRLEREERVVIRGVMERKKIGEGKCVWGKGGFKRR